MNARDHDIGSDDRPTYPDRDRRRYRSLRGYVDDDADDCHQHAQSGTEVRLSDQFGGSLE
jgi:hypothetical protein